jgi:pimeloyl-ACP methyl ester carboxylesterase
MFYPVSADVGFIDYGGVSGRPPIVLLHGLMGRGRTWRRQIPWLRRYGRVFTYDAAWHRGAETLERPIPESLCTERFVGDLAEVLTWIDMGPAVLIGHSMGGLHAWCAAAEYPELVGALVIEDMAPDFRGRTTAGWQPWFESWPDRFESQARAQQMFGDVAGRYFYEAFDEGELHGRIDTWATIAEEWGRRDFWQQWQAVTVPSLLLEAEHSVTPPGQMRAMADAHDNSILLRVRGSGHLVHDAAPDEYRGAVEAFLCGLM